MKCSKCGQENEAHARFCERCGNSLAPVCPNCGSPVGLEASFCNQCGRPLDQSAPSTAALDRLAALQQSAPSELKEKIRLSSARMEGERKPVTILFTDIVGSTSLAEKLDPEEWKEIVSGAHRRVSQVVYRYEGTIAQLLGDGVLAFFGAPVTHEDDPVRAVRAALDIQASIEEYAVELKGILENFQVRIGLNTGTVVVGAVGSDLHMEYLAVGDAVNLAARMQSAARPGGVLISESTARNVKAVFDLQDLGGISVKGKAEPVNVYEVVGLKAVPESGRGFAEISSPLVGRSCELGALNEVLGALHAGHGQVVAIIGEAGIGKSRLVEEARQEDAKRAGQVHWIEGRALSYGQTLSFWTITQLIYSDLGLTDGDPEIRVRAALNRRVNALFAGEDAQVLPYLAELLGVRLEGEAAEKVRQLDGETLHQQTLQSLCRYFQGMAEERPTVAVFEDLHWADPSSLEALEALLAVTDRAPLMLLLLSRLEREHGSWRVKLRAETDYSHRYTEIPLKPLTPTEQTRLVENLLSIADFPEAVRDLILEHSEGNPFYLEEIVRSLIDQGAILRSGEIWQATREIDDISIPETLEGVLLARIDRLQEDVRRTLQMAAVIGKSFLYRLLESIAAAEQQLDQHLAQLQRVDLVREKAITPELEYMFKHSLTQEAAYNSLLLERRREFHRRVGEALESLFSDRIGQYLGLLAHHFEAAGDAAKATGYLIQAGDRARLTDEHTEAIGYYQRAVTMLESQNDGARLAQVWLKLGLIYHANFQFEAAHQANENAFALQKKTFRLAQAEHLQASGVLRFNMAHRHVTLDPGQAVWSQDVGPIRHLFSGLVDVDEELNVVPALARSWQVLEQGRRHLFHLRDDAAWTDGSPVTAADFEWAWKRNLSPDIKTGAARFLYDVLGAREIHEGKQADMDQVGVRALDDLTLEVRLEQPVAYFPFILSMPVTYPLPRRAIQAYGEAWCLPGHIVSNGPYRLVEFDPEAGAVIERNPGYFGAFPGNIGRVEWDIVPVWQERSAAYQQNRVDFSIWHFSPIPEGLSPGELVENPELGLFYVIFAPVTPPLDDLRVRKALGMALNKPALAAKFNLEPAVGGLVPPGMPGHSPGIALPYDPDAARQLLAQAGFPQGRGFPVLRGVAPQGSAAKTEVLTRGWREILGVEILFEEFHPWEVTEKNLDPAVYPIYISGWIADFPDPDNFLHTSDPIFALRRLGWRDPDYERLMEEAASTPDRARRMGMYRQADRRLVAEQALALPLYYNKDILLVKPWVQNFRANALGYFAIQNMLIQEH